MNVFYILGSIGGIVVLIDFLVSFIKGLRRFCKRIQKYRNYYERHHKEENDVKIPMGFRTEKEQAEIEAMMARKG